MRLVGCITSITKKRSADYRHTLSWLTTSHNSLWEIRAFLGTIIPTRIDITRLRYEVVIRQRLSYLCKVFSIYLFANIANIFNLRGILYLSCLEIESQRGLDTVH